MRRLSVLLTTYLLVLFNLLMAQTSDDPQSQQLLALIATQSGWSNATTLQDAIMTGHVQRSGDSSGVPIEIKATRSGKFKILTNGFPTVISSDIGAAKAVQKGMIRLPYLPDNAKPVFLPFYLRAFLGGTDWKVSYLGVSQYAKESLQCVGLTRPVMDNGKLNLVATKTHQLMVCATVAGMLRRIDYNVAADDNPSGFFHYTRIYSDYASISGVMVPLRQEEWIENRLRYTFTFEEVKFNSGIADSEFDLPAEGK